ncbi:hypothetical protein SAMN02910456_00545 [Ruminococcaceae bacterium YRB3002]|nr:hypothetical protein SAMN02910456_00545 [Ruminococcaceae bacterium YRB3002]
MNRLEQFRFGNLRRRKVRLILLTVALLVVLSGLILLLMGIFGFRSELVSISLTDQNENVRYNGVGVNLDYIPNVNLVRNPSFEKESSYYSMTVVDDSGSSLFFDPDEVIASGINTSKAIGAPIRIVSIDAAGNMQLRFEGVISGYESARLGQIKGVVIPQTFDETEHIVKTVVLQNTVSALTESGLVYADITSEQLVKAYDGGNVSFADICSNDNMIYAVTGDGIVFSSADGKTYLEMNSVDSNRENFTVKACAATAGCLTVITADGGLCVYDSGRFYDVPLMNGVKVSAIGATDDMTFVVSEDGRVLRSNGGFIYSLVDTGDIYGSRTAKTISCSNSSAYILNDDGSVTMIVPKGASGDEVKLLKATSGTGSTATSLTVTDKGQIVASTDDNTAVIISDKTGDSVTISSEDLGVSSVHYCTGNRIILMSSRGICTASVLSDFTLAKDIPEDAVQTGDICFIETNNSYASLTVEDNGDEWAGKTDPSGNGVWEAIGAGTSIELTADNYDGKSAVRLSGITDNLHVLSQKLPGKSSDLFIKDKFYKISLYMRSDSVPEKGVMAWLEGKNFGRQGITAKKISEKFTEYSAVFIVNDIMTSDDDVRINIAFEGVGSVMIDQIYVGPDSIGESDIPQSFTDGIKTCCPAAIRLNNLGIGRDGFCADVFYGISELSTGTLHTDEDGNTVRISDVRSLEKSLRLVREADADPWFVLGSFTGREQVEGLIAYMCGSVSSDYGAMRINNGTALPWSRQFDKVYIEINDSSSCFTSDVQRSSYVDYVIGLITQSEYYMDLKDKIIFIDGMQYDGGTMTSSADAHASELTISSEAGTEDRDLTFIERLGKTYETTRYNAPRVTAGNDMGEFISRVELDGEFNAARILAAFLGDDTYFVELSMLDVGITFKPSLYGDWSVFEGGEEMKMVFDVVALIRDMEGTGRMYVNVADPMSSEGEQTAAEFLTDCSVSQFDSENGSYLVIANTSPSLRQFVMYNGGKRYQSSAVRRYSDKGRHLNTKSLTNSYRRYNLQPGEAIIVTIDR